MKPPRTWHLFWQSRGVPSPSLLLPGNACDTTRKVFSCLNHDSRTHLFSYFPFLRSPVLSLFHHNFLILQGLLPTSMRHKPRMCSGTTNDTPSSTDSQTSRTALSVPLLKVDMVSYSSDQLRRYSSRSVYSELHANCSACCSSEQYLLARLEAEASRD